MSSNFWYFCKILLFLFKGLSTWCVTLQYSVSKNSMIHNTLWFFFAEFVLQNSCFLLFYLYEHKQKNVRSVHFCLERWLCIFTQIINNVWNKIKCLCLYQHCIGYQTMRKWRIVLANIVMPLLWYFDNFYFYLKVWQT